MDDLISRQAAIDNLERYRELFSWDDGDRERAILSRVIKELQSMPTAEPREGKWIPMAKRSPEESGRYLVTICDGATTMATVAQWHPRAKAWEMTGRRAHYHVTAWIPLPKPYKGGEV